MMNLSMDLYIMERRLDRLNHEIAKGLYKESELDALFTTAINGFSKQSCIERLPSERQRIYLSLAKWRRTDKLCNMTKEELINEIKHLENNIRSLGTLISNL